jgi:hypothetical protein
MRSMGWRVFVAAQPPVVVVVVLDGAEVDAVGSVDEVVVVLGMPVALGVVSLAPQPAATRISRTAASRFIASRA